MRRTNVKHHLRRTRKGMRPVRQHQRKLNYGSKVKYPEKYDILYRGVSKPELRKIKKQGKLVIEPKYITDGSGGLSFTDDITKAKRYGDDIVTVVAEKENDHRFKGRVMYHDGLGGGKYTHKVYEPLPIVDIQDTREQKKIEERLAWDYENRLKEELKQLKQDDTIDPSVIQEVEQQLAELQEGKDKNIQAFFERNFNSNIFLGKESTGLGKLFNPVASPKGQVAYTMTKDPESIYLGDAMKNADRWDINQVADVVAHEELHNVLSKAQGPSTSKALDNITIPSVFEDASFGKINNPKSTGKIDPQMTKAMKTITLIPDQTKRSKLYDEIVKDLEINYGSFPRVTRPRNVTGLPNEMSPSKEFLAEMSEFRKLSTRKRNQLVNQKEEDKLLEESERRYQESFE